MPGLFSQRRGTVRTLQVSVCSVKLVFVLSLLVLLFYGFYITLCIFYIILCNFILFYVLFYIILCNFWVYMCTNHCHRVFTQLHLANISTSSSGVIQRQFWRPFHKTISKIVLKGGLGAGIGAQLPKGSTLKVTTVVFSNEVCSTFTAISSRTLLSSDQVSATCIPDISCHKASTSLKTCASFFFHLSPFPHSCKFQNTGNGL
jgi:hypothetical protein